MKKYKYVIIEQAEDNEAYITMLYNSKDVENYQSIGIGEFIVLSIEAYYNLIQGGLGY